VTLGVVLAEGARRLREREWTLARGHRGADVLQVVHQRVDIRKLGERDRPFSVARAPARSRAQPHRERLRKILIGMTLRIPTRKMSNEARAATVRAVAIGIRGARCAEERAPARAAMQPVRVLNRVSGLVPHDRHARRSRSTFDGMHLSTLESHESGVGEVERDRDSGNAARREPVFGEPYMRSHSQRAFRELLKKLLMTIGHPFTGLRQAQFPKAQREQPLVAPPGPCGKWGSPAGHPHIQRSSNEERNSQVAIA